MEKTKLKQSLEAYVNVYNESRVRSNCSTLSSREEAMIYDFISSYITYEEHNELEKEKGKIKF